MSDEYLNFDLLITGDGQHHYRINVINSPGGTASAIISPPFTDQEVQEFLDVLNESLDDTVAARESVERFGGKLFREVFSREIYALWRNSLNQSADQNKWLRLRLRLTDAPKLSFLPWEYLFDDNEKSFLALSSKISIVRYLDVPKRVPSLLVQGPLRVAVMISSPKDYPQLDVDQEWERLNESLKNFTAKQVILRPLRGKDATRFALQGLLQKEDIHIFHFIGHGEFDEEQGGCLILQDEEGNGCPLRAEALKVFLGNHDFLRLVVLNACKGAMASRDDAFAGMAQSLFRAGIPAVVAQRMEITDSAAITFTREFYRAIANYYPLDAAVAEARSSVYATNHIEWATPCLYLRSEDGQLFEKAKKASPSHAEDHSHTEDRYERMIERLMNGEVVVFLGPDANVCDDTHPPDDFKLASRLRRGASLSLGADWGLPRLSQYIETVKRREWLYSELRDTLGKKCDPNPLHRFLAKLPSLLRNRGAYNPHQIIVTGNYDDALEEAFREAGEPFDLVCYKANEQPYGRFYHTPPGGKPKIVKRGNEYNACSPENRTVILKMHGAVDRSDPQGDSFVITEDNYIAFPNKEQIQTILPLHLFNKLGSSHFLFLGWRVVDWNYRVILHRLRKNLCYRGCAISQKSDAVDRQYWELMNVDLLEVQPEDYVAEMEKRLYEQRAMEANE